MPTTSGLKFRWTFLNLIREFQQGNYGAKNKLTQPGFESPDSKSDALSLGPRGQLGGYKADLNILEFGMKFSYGNHGVKS